MTQKTNMEKLLMTVLNTFVLAIFLGILLTPVASFGLLRLDRQPSQVLPAETYRELPEEVAETTESTR
ncbi:hypothetical protein A3K34_04030 [candidate division WWE3 bacterium RIFOXYC1_FULL_40_10]|nr:MAG: hypothetical protein A3K58_04030 [candidate division WWE3 bacterium RIFOXYB1_FULL_40_22]OGC62010.1 MAG: hypothetical protein A3K37_04030 [candidate division WWE3 bacterium RIFOXYA1_FULL_40_11]OGC65047.1 MAG: hypothetical protein A2326_03350 [candidate division WWE3 bacterium RIFOXYB2_FULL_41_6]OGC66393.1 MAG: hypothetical protein A3K34_04030 [candidate division WWE3 bacterium RIFOXYC1_FULL_40_10]OGC67994.1 MAG: hypothetical protein A2450_02225 [candidate division WWE3 bacterium RIFOXYC2